MHTTSTLVTSLEVTPATAKWLCVELGVPSNLKMRFALGVVIRVKVPAPVADAPPAVAAVPTRVAAVRRINAGRTRMGGSTGGRDPAAVRPGTLSDRSE